jgi:hypothetical protein
MSRNTNLYHVRLSPEQGEWVRAQASIRGMAVSEFIRHVVERAIAGTRRTSIIDEKQIDDAIKKLEEN